MKREKFSARRRQVITLGAVGAAALAAPVVYAASELEVQDTGGKVVVSGRVVGATGGHPLAGAQIEIWQADTRGMRAESTREVVITDGDGRYFVALKGNAQRLHYRISHKDHATKVARLHVTSARQREATMTRDSEGTMRVAFEMTLAPRNLRMAAAPDYITL